MGNKRCGPLFKRAGNFFLKSVQDKGIKPFMQREFLREKKIKKKKNDRNQKPTFLKFLYRAYFLTISSRSEISNGFAR